MVNKSEYGNFVEVISNHCKTKNKKNAYIFLSDNGEIEESCQFGGLHQKAMTVAGFLKEHTRPGDRALLLYSPGLPFIYAFMGCLYAGVIAVPVFPPLSPDMLHRLKHIKNDADPKVILTNSLLAAVIQADRQSYADLCTPLLVDTQSLDDDYIHNYQPVDSCGRDLAFLQYTSGSTGYPKGVMVSHANLLSNEAIIHRFTRQTVDSVMMGWLPHFHDMGLIGCILYPCYVGFLSVLMSPQRFMRNPLTWLKAISDFQCTITTAPNFAYERCVRYAAKLGDQKLDLSRWNTAINGAEPVRPETLSRFYHTFTPHGFRKQAYCPAFGLAEGTLFVTGIQRDQAPNTLHINRETLLKENRGSLDPKGTALVGHGKTDDTQELIIADPDTFSSCEPLKIGEIWLKGPSVAAGYWNKPDATAETFHAHLKDGRGPFLRTGDLGFLHNGELYITGRLKDVIIIQGRNYYPQDIEEAVENVSPDFRPGRVIAFAMDGEITDAVCIVAEYVGEPKRAKSLYGAVNQKLSLTFGVKIERLILIKPKTLLVTTSGKVRRKDTRSNYLDGRLDIIATASRPEKDHKEAGEINGNLNGDILAKINDIVARRLKVHPSELDDEIPLGQFGLTSSDAVELAAEFEILTGRPFSPTLVYENPTIKSLAELIRSRLSSTLNTEATISSDKQEDPIAIIGMGCNFPGAPDIHAFWHLLQKGKDAVTTISQRRPSLDAEKLATHGPGLRWGAFIDDAAEFDAGFFNISSAEAQWMDPQHRKFMETVWAAMENAGQAPSRLAGSPTGVFVGVSAQDYNQLVCLHQHPAGTFTATGLSNTMLANRISYLLDLHGPSETIDTACSSSLVAVHRAVQSIRQGECEQAIAGGVSLLLSPIGFIALSKSGFLSPDGKCKTFDAKADGYVRGEGVGAVYLKPLSKALADKDHIHAIIKGSALYHGGRTASLTAPNENAQAQLISQAHKNAGISPDSISYIELHGTGTALGDPIEVNGLIKAFHPPNSSTGKSPQKTYCALGAVKTNIGHLEAAAGIAGLIKTAMALKHRSIPATINYAKQNPLIDLNDTPFYIAAQNQHLPQLEGADGEAVPMRAGVSAFGFGGTYAHVVLEEAMEPSPPEKSTARPVLMIFSAKTPQALKAYMKSFETYLDALPKMNGRAPSMADMAYTLQTGRDHWAHRIAFIPSNWSQFKSLLKTAGAAPLETRQPIYSSPCRNHREEYRRLQQLAEAWLRGDAIDWLEINARTNARKIPLPVYPFEKQTYWFADIEQAKAPSESQRKSHSPRYVSESEAIQWLREQAAEHIGIPITEIDPESTFEEIGLDSIALINIHERMQDYFGMELSISIIQEYPNIRSLARLVAVHENYETPDFFQEVAREKERFRSLIENRPEKDRRQTARNLGRAILLTGATGFLGAFLLRALLQNSQAKIYCLVRADGPQEGMARLQRAFDAFKISDCRLEERVEVICGDLAQARFGMDSDTYERIAETIDTVLHSGAIVDWMKSYMSLKKTNVDGTAEAITFCARGKIKQLHYISSLAVLPLIEGKTKWLESDDPDPTALTNGYSQSKWVAERLCLEARRMGLGVNIFRFDFVAGNIDTGAMKETDFIVRLIKGCIQLGYIPAEEVNFDILSADHLSKVMVMLCRLNQQKTYHLINRQPFSTCDYTRIIRSFGYRLERIPFDTWKQVVKTSPACDLYALYPFIDHYTTENLAQYHASRIDNTNTLSALYEIDPDMIINPPSAEKVLTRVMHFFSESGRLPKAKFTPRLERQAAYWKLQLTGATEALALPFKLRNKTDSTAVTSVPVQLPDQLYQEMEILAHKESIGLSELLLTAFQVLLFRYCRQADVPVTVPIALPAGEGAVPIAKTAIIRTILPPGATFRSALHYVSQVVAEAESNLDLPSDDIGRLLYPEDEGADKILYDTMFIYNDHDAPEAERLNLNPLSLEAVWQETSGLKLYLEKSDGKFSGALVYREHLFEKNTLVRMIEHFNHLLSQVVQQPDVDIFTVPIMGTEALTTIVDDWNAVRKPYPIDKCIDEIFSRHAAQRPNAVALRTETQTMSYGELDLRSDQLAAYLTAQGVSEGELIGICADKSFELMIGLLGILKAGGAYFPIEPSYPESRKQFMLEDADANIIITRSAQRDAIPKTHAKIICVDDDWDHIATHSLDGKPPRKHSGPQGLAYMIYTSGSTGKPKGLQVTHSSLVNLMYVCAEEMTITPDDCMLTSAALSFDLSVFELFYPLAHGAGLALLPRSMAGDGQQLKAFLEENPITYMAASVPTWRLLEYAGWKGNPNIRLVNSGEALSYDLVQTLVGWSKAAYNAYGPAEATVFTTVKHLEPECPVTIGKVLPNYQVYIVDEHFNPMPIDAYGELYIGGEGLSQGYHNRPELNREKFIPNPIRPELSQRLYRTGDLACFREDGEIVFKGRMDNQIKLRGYRIELGEIEHALSQDDQVKSCVVIARQDPGQEKKIVAYVVPKTGPRQADIVKMKQTLNAMLPAYMLPSDFVLMDQFPATPGGKVDRKALPMPGTAKLTDTYAAPETTVEEQLSDIWKAILNIDKVGLHNNFLDMGGNSILAMKLLLEINRTFGTDLTIQSLFENLTISELSREILGNPHSAAKGSTKKIDYAAESVFDLEVDTGTLAKPADIPNQFNQLLLTGVTGFLGVYLLRTLLDRTSAEIHCLVRATTAEEGRRRIEDKMKEFLLYNEQDMHRVKTVIGDLGEPDLGISSMEYERLCEQIDAVYHCGSVVNFSFPYSFLKKPNVEGTKEVIRLCLRKKMKHLFYISTVGVFEEKGLFTGRDVGEDDPLPGPEGLFTGYTRSKWVSERIITVMREKGLPITIFRPGSVMGHSTTGISNLDDLAIVMIRVFNTVGAIPDIDFGVNMLPVDFVADTIVRLSMDPASLGKNLHVVNAATVPAKKLIDYYVSFGYDSPKLSFDKWLETLKEAAQTFDFLQPYIPVIEYTFAELSSGAYPNFRWDNTATLLKDYRQIAPEVTEKLFHTYLKYLEQVNYIRHVN